LERGVYCENFAMIGQPAHAGDSFKNRASIPLAPCICLRAVQPAVERILIGAAQDAGEQIFPGSAQAAVEQTHPGTAVENTHTGAADCWRTSTFGGRTACRV
jgi:hypothetical protein